jgi:hypothetical protein
MTLDEKRQIVRFLIGAGFSVVSVSGDGSHGSPFQLVIEVKDGHPEPEEEAHARARTQGRATG